MQVPFHLVAEQESTLSSYAVGLIPCNVLSRLRCLRTILQVCGIRRLPHPRDGVMLPSRDDAWVPETNGSGTRSAECRRRPKKALFASPICSPRPPEAKHPPPPCRAMQFKFVLARYMHRHR